MKRLAYAFLVLGFILIAIHSPGLAAPGAGLLQTPGPTAVVDTGDWVEGNGVGGPQKGISQSEAFGPDFFLPSINPLTGLQVDDLSLLERRPMAIKVTLHPRYVRPQSGLSMADVVYEYYMEEGISRFIGVFYGQDAEKVGPVRSGRFFDEHVFTMYDAIFAFASADVNVRNYWEGLGPETYLRFVVEGVADGPHTCISGVRYALCRDPQARNYNNLFADTSQLAAAVLGRGGHNNAPDLTGMRFAEEIPAGGSQAENLFVRYSLIIYGKWEYARGQQQYLRSQETAGYVDTSREDYAPLTDDLTGQQLSADNVVVLLVPHRYYLRSASTEIVQIDLVGEGDGIAFRNGFGYPVRWVRPEDGGVIQLFTPEGEPFPLKPGQTWYEVMSLESSSARDGVDWRFSFAPPEVDGLVFPPGYFED